MLFKMKVKDSAACRDFASIWRAAWGRGWGDEGIKNESTHLIHEPGDYSDYGGTTSKLQTHTTPDESRKVAELYLGILGLH